MIIEKITYAKVFPLGQYINERIGVEIQVEETDDAKMVLEKAKSMVERWHIDTNPHLYLDHVPDSFVSVTLPPGQREPDAPPLSQMEIMKKEINSCKELKVLESYRLIVKNNPELQETYNQKLKDLDNGLSKD